MTPDAQGSFEIDGNRIIYMDIRDGDTTTYIYMFTFTLVPTDPTPPAITLTPACPATVTLNSSTSVDVMVTDEASGVATQSIPNGPMSLDTTTVGPHSLTIAAADHAGNTATAVCSYAVICDFAGSGGFSPPIEEQPHVNSVRAGGTVPIKWQLPDGRGGFIGEPDVVTSITFGEVSDFAASPDIRIDARAAGASALRYDAAAQQFVFNWKTDRDMSGRADMLVLGLNDGREYFANFTLK